MRTGDMKRTVLWSVILSLAVVWCAAPRGPAAPDGRRGTEATGRPWPIRVIDASSRGADGVKLADVNGDGLQDIATGWEEGGLTRIYLHPGKSKAKDEWPAVTVGKTPSVEDAVFVDLDGDGAVDVVSCCEGRTRKIFVHWAPRDRRQYAVDRKWTTGPIEASVGRMMWMFAFGVQIDGKNGVDIVAGGKGRGARIGWFEAPKNPRAMGEYKWHAISNAGWVMSMMPRDMDGDGDVDIVTSDRRGVLRGCRWLENPGPGDEQSKPWKNHFIGGRNSEVMFMTLADLDTDGLIDVLVAVKPANILFLRRLDKTGKAWGSQTIPYPGGMGGAKAVAVGDINLDKLPDLVVSCEGATPPKSGVRWMSCKNNKPGEPGAKWEAHEISGPPGIKYDRIELLDIDGDGDPDVLTCEERGGGKGLGVFWYENPSRGGR